VKIAYLVHDLHDAAVARRCAQFARGGADIILAGFTRGSAAPGSVAGLPAIGLGRTQDARLAQRAGMVLRKIIAPGGVARITRDADVIVARNLEMLAIAARVRRRGQRLVYECLDIHRLLLGTSKPARLLQAVEQRLLRAVDLVIVSSPSFADDYFRQRRGHRGPILLVENKVTGEASEAITPPPPPPWVIGWFGMIRCAKSLALLAEIVRQSAGRIELLIAGRPALSEFSDFEAQVAAVPGIRFIGPYRPDDLAKLYGGVHFAWAIDYFEEGLNSTWLLPNRLYESIAHGAVPIALKGVTTGKWLAKAGVGILLDDPAAKLPARLAALDAAGYATLRAGVAALPASASRITDADIEGLMEALAGAAA
jgi:succinoglycan biosynthesis protein ExoL